MPADPTVLSAQRRPLSRRSAPAAVGGDALPPPVTVAPPRADIGPAGRTAGPGGPSPAGRELIRNLPDGLLHATAARFPHVIEAIARDWAEPARLHETLDTLLFDARGDRGGFPAEVVFELAELRARYERWVGPRGALGR
jgi:hypothetical protein